MLGFLLQLILSIHIFITQMVFKALATAKNASAVLAPLGQVRFFDDSATIALCHIFAG
jgi:hypothetical protein